MPRTFRLRSATPQGPAWADLADSYNTARLVIGTAATLSSIAVGVANDWPRGPWLFLLSAALVGHAHLHRSSSGRSVTSLLLIDAVTVAAGVFVIGIPTVALLSIAFLMISASALEVDRRAYVLWAVDLALVALAMALDATVGLEEYTESQAALTETVGLVFFAVACVVLTRILVIRLRRIDAERRETRQRLSAHDNRYRAMLAYSSDGIVVTDAGLRLVELGPQNERLTGFSSDDRVGGSMLDLVIDEDRGTLLEAYNKVVRMPDEPARFKVRIRRSDGEVRLMSATARNLLHDPHLEGFVFNFHDVTEEDALRRSLELFGVTPDADVSR